MSELVEVSSILEHRTTDAQGIEYLVQWASDQAQTWEPSTNLTECTQTLAAYWRTHVCSTPAAYLQATVIAPPEPKPRVAPKKARAADPATDRIAVAKRVQANKQLRGSLARSGTIAAAPLMKPPPLNAKRSTADAAGSSSTATLTPVSETANMVADMNIRPIQRARKSTGRRPK
ncbi:hypothetical protein IWW50_004289 [Coemansia erecta]|nr:hypothetical protein IWW50_004289 [Coemansia erecta]